MPFKPTVVHSSICLRVSEKPRWIFTEAVERLPNKTLVRGAELLRRCCSVLVLWRLHCWGVCVLDVCCWVVVGGGGMLACFLTLPLRQWHPGHIQVLSDLQQALGEGPLIANHAYGPPHDLFAAGSVSFAMIEGFGPNNASVNQLRFVNPLFASLFPSLPR
jgi:hypothetical protein